MRSLLPALCLTAFLAACQDTREASAPMPEPRDSAEQSDGYAGLDEGIRSLMDKYQIPGASIAVAVGGEVVHTACFGWANVEEQIPVTPESMFRIGSISKMITAAAIRKLVENGKLRYEDRAFQLLPELLPDDIEWDPRLLDITVEDLLHHHGGWDRGQYGDPMLRETTLAASRYYGIMPPGITEHLIRYRLRHPLDFVPGSRYAYSNLGYLVLGEVIEKMSGEPYADFVLRELVPEAEGINLARGSSRQGAVVPGEVKYYDFHGGGLVASVFDTSVEVPWPYGGFDLESLLPACGWKCSASDLAMLAHAIFDAQDTMLLEDEIRSRSTNVDDVQYWMGWRVKRDGERQVRWHHGTMPGSTSLLFETDRCAVSVLMNGRPEDFDMPNEDLLKLARSTAGD